MGLPLDAEKLKTGSGGQVLGLGTAAVQGILKRHGETRILAKEGGRTSRGSIGNMKAYVDFLNAHAPSKADLEEAERFWVERIRAFFAGKPFKVKFDRAKSLRAVVAQLLGDADRRQKDGSGTQYVGAVAQHLVGAKLRLLYGSQAVTVESFSTSDDQSRRAGDFEVGDSAIHVTATPTEALIRKCVENFGRGLRPIIVTTRKGSQTAEGLAENAGVGGRIDIFDIEQFVATNLYEHGEFAARGAASALKRLIDAYNEIVDDVETDPSLKIEET